MALSGVISHNKGPAWRGLAWPGNLVHLVGSQSTSGMNLRRLKGQKVSGRCWFAGAHTASPQPVSVCAGPPMSAVFPAQVTPLRGSLSLWPRAQGALGRIWTVLVGAIALCCQANTTGLAAAQCWVTGTDCSTDWMSISSPPDRHHHSTT